MKLLLATTSQHKLEEIRALLADVPLELLTLRDFPDLEMPEETGDTMAANARLKAEAGARATGLLCLADDSGLEVDALNGAPGVHSARWVEGSDEDRMHALLDRMQDVPDERRNARYRCASCLASPEAVQTQVEATCSGRIARAPQGSNGFGYDPIFQLTPISGVPPEYIGQTMAQAPPKLKAAISHRARAVLLLKPELRA